MSFTAPEYVIFLPLAALAYFAVPLRWRWLVIVIASYFFYAYGSGVYVLLIIFSTLVDYTAARLISASSDKPRRRLYLALSLSVNLGVLFVFKYFNFANESARLFFESVGIDYTVRPLDLLLPIGISFYTFQSMAYTIDVYRGIIPAEKHLGVMAAFISFFPQLVAGPIERAPNILPQFRIRFRFDPDRTVSGLRLILWGAFKKIAIADRLAIYVNTVYDAPANHDGGALLLATIFFGFQIYCDFSAYSDIAIGSARILGFELMENFRQPYFARTVREFWARWHISLSTWFRDYLYIPLGGNRVPFPRALLNLFIVFLVSGVWHGASWTFVLWGALHGVYVMVEAFARRRNWRFLPAPFGIALTFTLVTLAWVLFRANTIDDAAYIFTHLFAFAGADVTQPFAAGILGAPTEFALSCGLITLLLGVDALIARFGMDGLANRLPTVPRWAAYYALGAAVVFSGLYNTGAQQFIYFRF